MQHLTEISRDFPRLHALSPLRAFLKGSLLLLFFLLSFIRFVLPFRVVISPLPANYAVVANCHVIKLHLFTMRRDCHRAFD